MFARISVVAIAASVLVLGALAVKWRLLPSDQTPRSTSAISRVQHVGSVPVKSGPEVAGAKQELRAPVATKTSDDPNVRRLRQWKAEWEARLERLRARSK